MTRSAAVAVQVVFCLTAMIGIAAVSVDGGMLFDHRRRAQAAADAAALAAANDLYRNWPLNNGVDKNGTARDSARHIAQENGFQHDVNATVEVNIPPSPLNPLFAGKTGYVEVIVTQNQAGYFTGIFGASATAVSARAIARGRWAGDPYALIALAPTLKGSLNANGGGTVTVANGGVQVNSNSSEALIVSGGGNFVSDRFSITGVPGVSITGGGNLIGPVTPDSPPLPDPLAYLPPPDPSSLPLRSSKALVFSSDPPAPLEPGVYVGGIKVSNGLLVLKPGIYYLKGGGFTATGHATISAEGVMIYNAPTGNSDGIAINEPGSVVIHPMTTGIYRGLSIFQERTATAEISLAGNGAMDITGTLYAAGARVKLTGNGTTNVIGSQCIAYEVQTAGNGALSVIWNPDNIARARYINLVE